MRFHCVSSQCCLGDEMRTHMMLLMESGSWGIGCADPKFPGETQNCEGCFYLDEHLTVVFCVKKASKLVSRLRQIGLIQWCVNYLRTHRWISIVMHAFISLRVQQDPPLLD